MSKKDLDEVYCERIRNAGSHGTWEPSTGIWPSEVGAFRKGVFSPSRRLPEDEYGYTVVARGYATELIETSSISARMGTGPVTYRFRVLSPYEADFPFLRGVSNVVVVHER